MKLPNLSPSRFTEHFLATNAMDPTRFRAWALAPGMGLGQRESWWGSFKPRPMLHEGVDLCCYYSHDGGLHLLPERVQVPAIFEGVVGKLLPDYLGTSVFIEHRMDDGVLLTIFGHTLPRPGLAVGDRLQAGEGFCAVAPRLASGTAPRAHLHLTLAWSREPVVYDGLDWSNMGERLELLDPALVLGASCEPLRLEAFRGLD